MNSSLSQRQYKLLLFFLTLFIFIFWFAQGYTSVLWIDPIKEMIGDAISLKFPETLWNKNVRNSPYNFWMSQWHIARWTADIMPYFITQLISKPYAFIFKDPVSSIYIGQGVMIAIYYTLLSWVFAIYTKRFLNLSIFSSKFLFLLFCTGIICAVFVLPIGQDITNLFYKYFNLTRFGVHYYNANARDTHYTWTTTLMLIALYPFWDAYLNNNQWNKKYDVLSYRIIWYISILWASFSTVVITSMYLTAQAFIGFSILFCLPHKKIVEKIQYLLLTPPPYVKALYFGGIACFIALGAEMFFGLSRTLRGSRPFTFINNLPLIAQFITTFSYFFLMVYIYCGVVYIYKKINKNSQEWDKNLTRLLSFTLLNNVLMIVSCFSTISLTQDIYVYKDHIVIFTLLNMLLFGGYILEKIKSPIPYACTFIFLFSRYLYNIPHYPNNIQHLEEYQYYQQLHLKNNTRTNKQIFTDLSRITKAGGDLEIDRKSVV